jgi:required for meiotic nuclear division protein 1
MRIPFKAWYFRSTIDEEKVRKKFSELDIEFEDPLVIRVSESHRVLITSFGAVVFWPFDEAMAKLVSGRIRETLTDQHVVEEVEDRLTVHTGAREVRFLHNEIRLKSDASPMQMRFIAMLLAQSVALDHLEREVDGALGGYAPYLENLRTRGRIGISTSRVLKSIGFSMQTRHSVLTNLALFDKPAETWESEEIEDLYQGLRDFFDLAERQEVLNAKLDFVNQNTSMLFEVISARRLEYLEWIVIILIAIEIVYFAVEGLLK